jgi:hypothetical protein
MRPILEQMNGQIPKMKKEFRQNGKNIAHRNLGNIPYDYEYA